MSFNNPGSRVLSLSILGVQPNTSRCRHVETADICLVYKTTLAGDETELSSGRCAISTMARQTEQMFYLEDVVARLHVRDVNPLAVDVMSVRVPAANCNALGPEVRTFVPLLDT